MKRVGKTVALVCFSLFSTWCFLAILFSNLPFSSLRGVCSAIYLIVTIVSIVIGKGSILRRLRTPLIINLLILIWWPLIPARHDRDWSPDQVLLPASELRGNSLHVTNIRDCRYHSTKDYDVRHYDRVFDLEGLDSLWFVVEPFAGYHGAAHTMLSFGWKDGSFLAISVEIRKEKGESFSAVKGMFKQFELMYVLGDEKDLIGLRSNHRKDDVYLYPIKASLEKRKALLLAILSEVNRLKETPQFYHTIWNTCTTRIVRHVNEIASEKIPWSHEILFPAFADKLAFELGLIDTSLSFEGTRKRHHINEKARKFKDDPEFSKRIRE